MALQGSYGGLALGFMLVPSYLLIDVRFAEALDRQLPWGVVVRRAAALILVRTVGLLLDPYSLVIASVGVGLIWLVWAIRLLRRSRFRRWTSVAAAAAIVAGSYLIAYLVYALSVDTSTFRVSTLRYFRGAGVDLYGIFVPPDTVWIADLLGLHHNIGPLEAYSDGHNLREVYLGIVIIGLAIVGLVAGRRPGVRVVAASGAALRALCSHSVRRSGCRTAGRSSPVRRSHTRCPPQTRRQQVRGPGFTNMFRASR